MKIRMVVAASTTLMLLFGDPDLARAQAPVSPPIGRPAEETPRLPVEGESTGLFGTDLRLTVGVDVWFNQWQTGSATNDPRAGFKIVTLTALGVGFIPNVTLSYRRLFVSASYMGSTDYDFGTTSDIVSAGSSPPFVRETVVKASRQEVEATVGYQFFKTERGFIAALAGYKGIFQDFETTTRFALVTAPGEFFEPVISRNKVNFNGWFGGFFGAAALGNRAGIFGTAAGGALYPHCSPASCDEFKTAPYVASKVGASYRPFDIPLTFSAAYRVQVINTQLRGPASRGGNLVDLTHGLVLGANWRF